MYDLRVRTFSAAHLKDPSAIRPSPCFFLLPVDSACSCRDFWQPNPSFKMAEPCKIYVLTYRWCYFFCCTTEVFTVLVYMCIYEVYCLCVDTTRIALRHNYRYFALCTSRIRSRYTSYYDVCTYLWILCTCLEFKRITMLHAVGA